MKQSFLVAGLGFGDESKGACVDHLCHKYDASLVVRYSGGCQSGHSVVMPDGRSHIFQQFGAGSFHGARTHLSRFMLINPMNQMREEQHLRELGITNAWKNLTIDDEALIITPFHRELNRLASKPGTNSCGQGIGVCRELHLKYGDNVLFAGDMYDEAKVRTKLRFIQLACLSAGLPAGIQPDNILRDENAVDVCWDSYKIWREYVRIVPRKYGNPSRSIILKQLLDNTDTIVFEGAQGVLLDETHGTPGFNTWTDTTFNNANRLLDEAGFTGKRIRVGVTRTYATRHGAGPFPTEDPALYYPEPHNEDSSYQGKFRRGRFDSHAFLDAIRILGGIDMLAVNHTDQEPWRCPMEVIDFPTIYGSGPTYLDRRLE